MMGKFAKAIENFKKRGRGLFTRTPEEWKIMDMNFRELSSRVEKGRPLEEIEVARKAFLEACEAYHEKYEKNGKEAQRIQAAAVLYEQIRELSEKDIQAAVFNRVSLEKYAGKQESYYERYQKKMIEYRSVSSARIPEELKKMQSSVPGIDFRPVTEYRLNSDAVINETNVKAEIKKLDDYRRTCRELMEEGRKTWNFALENYARRLYRQTLDSPLDNLRDLRLVRELESTGAKISDTDKYRTPEVQVNLDRTKTQGAGLSDRYSGVQLGNTRGFLTPFKGGNYENQVNRVGELMHRVDLSRQATAVLDWIRCNIYIDLNDLNGLESSFERLQNSPDLQQKMGISADLGEVYKELTEKKVFRAWQTDYGMMSSYQYAMGEEGQKVFEHGFIEKRNVAMSRVAELLGIGDVLARSRIVTFNAGGKKRHGCFMDQAEGIQIGSLTEEQEQELMDASRIEVTPEAWKKTERLLLLDTICGQADRHFGNFFLEYSKNGDGKLEVTGVKGIDNDVAFASRAYSRERYVLDNFRPHSHVNGAGDGNSLFVDETLADKVRNLTEDDLRYAVGDCLPETDIQALWERTKKVKELLDPTKNKEDHIVVLRDDEKDWKFQRDAKGRIVPSQTEHRLWAEGAPDRDAFVKNFRIFVEEKEYVSMSGCKLLRVEDSLRAKQNDLREQAEKKAADPEKEAKAQEKKAAEAEKSEKSEEKAKEVPKETQSLREKTSFEEMSEEIKASAAVRSGTEKEPRSCTSEKTASQAVSKAMGK